MKHVKSSDFGKGQRGFYMMKGQKGIGSVKLRKIEKLIGNDMKILIERYMSVGTGGTGGPWSPHFSAWTPRR